MFKKISPFLLLIFSAFAVGYAKVYIAYEMANPSIGINGNFLVVASLALIYYSFKIFWHYKIWVLISIFIFGLNLVVTFPPGEVMQKGYSPFSLPLSVSAGLATVGSITGGVIYWILLVKGIIFIYKLVRFGFRKSKRAFNSVNPKVQEKLKPALSKVKESVKEDW